MALADARAIVVNRQNVMCNVFGADLVRNCMILNDVRVFKNRPDSGFMNNSVVIVDQCSIQYCWSVQYKKWYR